MCAGRRRERLFSNSEIFRKGDLTSWKPLSLFVQLPVFWRLSLWPSSSAAERSLRNLNLDQKRRLVTVVNETRGTLLGDRIEVADTSLSRFLGLIPKRGLNAGEGLWIRPSSGVHTFGMKFAIDVIGLDKNRQVIKLWQNLVPYRISSISGRLRSVVELSAGRIAECKVELGDVLQFE